MSGYQGQNGDITELAVAGLKAARSHKNDYADSIRLLAMDERRWSVWNMGSLWIGMLVSTAVYQVASGLIVFGMSWGGVLFTIVLGHFLMMVSAVVLGHFDAKHGLTYPILCKMVLGSKGTVMPPLVRGTPDCFWFGVQVWISGQTVNATLTVSLPLWNGLGPKELFISFLTFWSINMYIAGSESDAMQKLEKFAAPVLTLLNFTVIIWRMYTAGQGIPGLLSEPSIQGNSDVDSRRLLFPALLPMITFDDGITLSMAGFTRNCKTQKAQMVGQLVGAPVMTALIVFVGICGTVGVPLAFHEAIWGPVALVSKLGNPVTAIIFSLFIIMIALTTNVAANLVPPTSILTTLSAKKTSYKKAVPTKAVLALFVQPWNALVSAYDLIYNVCGLLEVLPGPISGPYLVSYLSEHKTHVDMMDLYRGGGGRYYYKGGWNTATIAIFLTTTAVTIAGKYIIPLNLLPDNACVIGSVGAGLLYYIYLKVQSKRNGANEGDEDDHQTRHDCVTE